MVTKEKEMIRCEKCSSSQVYIRFKTNLIACRRCGHISQMKIQKEVK